MSMQVHHGRRVTLSKLACAVLALAAPAAAPAIASAALTRGTVLAVNAHSHSLQLVRSGDVVRGYRYSARFPDGARFPAVRFGTELAYRTVGNRLTRVRVLAAHANRVSFYALVTSTAGGGLVVRLADGGRLAFGPSRVSDPGTRPKPGQTAPLTVTPTAGGLKVLIGPFGRQSSGGHHNTGSGKKTGGGSPTGTGPTGPTGPTGLSGPHPIEPHSVASGVVTNIGANSVTLQLPDGSTLSPTLPAASLAYLTTNVDLADCQTLTVDYTDGAAGPVLDAFTATGISTAAIPESLGDTCADESDGGIDVVGTITSLSSTALTLAIPGQPSQSYSADPSLDLPDTNAVGDLVDVTYTQNPDGSLVAQDVEYAEEYTTGTVLAVDQTAQTLWIADAITGHTDTFADGDASFSGLAPGEAVGVDYYVSGGQSQADDVDPLG